MKRYSREFLFKSTLMASAIASMTAPLIAQADPLENLPYAVSGGTPNLDMRLRYENVDQELPATLTEKASALTIRSRLGYTTGKWNGIDAQLEFENVTAIGDDDFQSTENGSKPDIAKYPVVADPEGSELNQAWIRYAGPAKTTVKVGRQRIKFDNDRHIGNVGWRQREQTYDGYLVTNTFLPKTTFDYAYLTNVNSFRFFTVPGRTANVNRDIEAQLIHLAYAHSKALSVSAYGYLLDWEANTAPAAPADSQTIGLRATGTVPLSGDFSLSYQAEYAQQTDYQDSTDVVDADYWLAELGGMYKKANLKVGYEVLGSNDGLYAFQTPLATLHAFQGWADMFLVTPGNGIQEFYVSVGGTVEKVALMARWSDYSADEGSGDYGSEINLQATRPITDQLSFGVKYADYSGETSAPIVGPSPIKGDVTKYWAWLEYKF
ncbi:MAG TPA: alginate export family protein [Solimonas sp.]|nr:alginate export family protein [Solimonas sp.]